MVYVTHDQVEAMTLADRICVLRDGRAEQVGTPAELYERPANLFVASFIGSPKIEMGIGQEGAFIPKTSEQTTTYSSISARTSRLT